MPIKSIWAQKSSWNTYQVLLSGEGRPGSELTLNWPAHPTSAVETLVLTHPTCAVDAVIVTHPTEIL